MPRDMQQSNFSQMKLSKKSSSNKRRINYLCLHLILHFYKEYPPSVTNFISIHPKIMLLIFPMVASYLVEILSSF